jgi:hypothetical protein
VGEQMQDTGRAQPPFGVRPVQFVDVMPRTPDQKVDLFPAALEAEAPAGLYTYLADPATEQYPACADLAVHVANDQLHARRAAAAGGVRGDAS